MIVVNAVSLFGFAIGIAMFFALRIAVGWFLWRLRGRPGLGRRPPMRLRNLLDDGVRRYEMEGGGKGYYFEKPAWMSDEDWETQRGGRPKRGRPS